MYTLAQKEKILFNRTRFESELTYAAIAFAGVGLLLHSPALLIISFFALLLMAAVSRLERNQPVELKIRRKRPAVSSLHDGGVAPDRSVFK